MAAIQELYNLKPYVKIVQPDPYIMQLRRTAGDGSEMLLMINSHIHESRKTRITFSQELTKNKYLLALGSLKPASRYRIFPDRENNIDLDMGPASSFLFVFSGEKNGDAWKSCSCSEVHGHKSFNQGGVLNSGIAMMVHVKNLQVDELKDLKDIPDFASFAGTVIYRNLIDAGDIRKK